MFSRAYLDTDNCPITKLDLSLDGGITRARLSSFLTTVRVSVRGFKSHIAGRAD